MEDRQRFDELTGTNRPTQTTTPHTPPHTTCGGGVSTAKKRERPLYGPHPTHTTNHTRMRVLGVGSHTDNRIDSYQRRRPRTAHVVVSVVTATGKRPAPSRTRKLSLTAPMVLHPPGCGRVGHHRAHLERTQPQALRRAWGWVLPHRPATHRRTRTAGTFMLGPDFLPRNQQRPELPDWG